MTTTPSPESPRYVVMGNPVGHSLSPTIHARFAAQAGHAMSYTTLLAPLDGFREAASHFFAGGGMGANVTLPFKVEAFEIADHASERARRAGAANFLAMRSGRLEADNTDGAGLVADLRANLGFPIAGARVLVVGAGGAARGVIAPLLDARPSRLVIANRTRAKAEALARAFEGVEGAGLREGPPGPYDIVINATSTSTRGEPLELAPGWFAHGSLAYDMAYGLAARPFLDRALHEGAARASDGLGMLVEQAAESFFLWRGIRPATAPILAELRARP